VTSFVDDPQGFLNELMSPNMWPRNTC